MLQLFLIFILFSCQHYGSNVEIVYKNSNGASYNESGYDVLKGNNEPVKKEKDTVKKPQKEVYTEAKQVPEKKQKVEEEKIVTNDSPVKAENSSLQISSKRESDYHVVQKGETYYSISRLYFLNPATLMKVNNASEGQILKTGTIVKLYEPENNSQKGEPSSLKIASSEKTTLAQAKPLQIERAQEKPLPKKPETQAIKVAESGTSPCGEKFIMPIASKNILYNFGDKLDGGVKSDGTVFKVSSEESVFASNKGEVAYVGDGFSDYGNIVIIKHAGSYFSIYGYLKSISLQKGQVIAKGEKISTTSTKEGKFYFSIRKGKTAINLKNCL